MRYLFCTWFVFEESSFRSDAGGPWLSYCAAPDVPDLVNLKRSGERNGREKEAPPEIDVAETKNLFEKRVGDRDRCGTAR